MSWPLSNACSRLIVFPLLVHSFLNGDVVLRAEVPKQPKEASGKVYSCSPGPWGDLKYFYIYLEAPENYVTHFPMPNSITKWSFPAATVHGLRALFQQAGLSAAFQDYVLAPGRLVSENGALTVFPPLPDLEAMTSAQRSLIYQELGKSDLNEFHKSPVLITSGDVDDWLSGSRLRPGLIEVIRRLTYDRGGVLAFSDLSAVLNHVVSDAEAQDFFKTITRTRSMIVRLEFSGKDDIEKLTDYWTGFNRYKDIAPILRSTSETDGVTRLDIIHLLPSMARRVLYSYPPIDLAIAGRMPDCHWTSLNFFNYQPKNYFLDNRLAASRVLESYVRVEPPYQLGDVLMFMEGETGQALHSCTYIADDIVFTKNGDNLVSPWILMKLNDVKQIYFHTLTGTAQGYRLKALAE